VHIAEGLDERTETSLVIRNYVSRFSKLSNTAISPTSLKTLYPELAAQWHPTRNSPLTPDNVRPGSNKKVWWLCAKEPSHQWQSTVSNRTAGDGCPVCSGKMVTRTTSFQALHPELAAQWHPTRNHPLTPDDVRPGSGKKVWWLCRKDPSHTWQAMVTTRALRGHGCPMCAGRLVTPTTCLQALHPKLASEWHPTKNVPLTPDAVRLRSNKRVWWLCGKNPSHEWQSTISNRAAGNGCPMCAGKITTPTTSLQALYPDLAAQWCATRNAPLTPDAVRPKSHHKVWWQCPKDKTHQ
jgi:hypothetical protein